MEKFSVATNRHLSAGFRTILAKISYKFIEYNTIKKYYDTNAQLWRTIVCATTVSLLAQLQEGSENVQLALMCFKDVF
jgi:hypothetical protein